MFPFESRVRGIEAGGDEHEKERNSSVLLGDVQMGSRFILLS